MIGKAGLRGWRSKVADVAAQPIARKTPLGEDTIRAVIGAVFLALSVFYVVAAVKDMVRSNDA